MDVVIVTCSLESRSTLVCTVLFCGSCDKSFMCGQLVDTCVGQAIHDKGL